MAELHPGADTLTVLFNDVVASTELRARLGDDQADGLRREVDELVAAAVARHEGTVVKGLGDGLMVAFAAPSQGLAAAVDLQRALEQRNATAAVAVEVRVGLSIGEVRVEGGDVFGTAVVEAARLCATAAAGQVLTAESVVALAGSRAGVAVQPVGALELKGLAEPLPTAEVAWWSRGGVARVPVASVPTADRRVGFVGRRLERLALDQALLGSRSRRSALVVLRGQPGAGRTRLVAEVARRAGRDGMVVLYGRQDGRPLPHQPLAEALRQLVDGLPADRLARHLGPGLAPLAALLPGLEGLVGVPPPVVSADELGSAVGRWLGGVSADDGVLLVLDDLAQAPDSLIDAVAALVAEPVESRLLVVAVGGGEDPDRDPTVALAQRVRDAGIGVEVVDVPPLGPGEVEALLDGQGVPAGPDRAATAAALLSSTGGNALYLVEALEALRSSAGGSDGPALPTDDPDAGPPAAAGAGAPAAGSAAGGPTAAAAVAALPTGVELLRARLDVLDPPRRRLLAAAAVAGLGIDVDLAARGAGADAPSLVAALEHAAGHRLVVHPAGGRWSFAHEAYRWLLESGLGGSVAEVHARLADALDDRAASGDEAAALPAAWHRLWSGVAPAAAGPLVAAGVAACRRAGAEDLVPAWSAAAPGA